jgi:hypothetical protein
MTPTQELKALYLENNRKRFPSLPEYARACPKYTDRTANGLSKMIIDFLRFKGHQAERISVTGRYLDQSKIVTNIIGQSRRIGTGKWIRPSMQPGTADLSAVIHGRAVKIEIKCKATGDNKQSAAQIEYQRQIESSGGIYIIAQDFAGFLTWYESFTPAENRVKLQYDVR